MRTAYCQTCAASVADPTLAPGTLFCRFSPPAVLVLGHNPGTGMIGDNRPQGIQIQSVFPMVQAMAWCLQHRPKVGTPEPDGTKP